MIERIVSTIELNKTNELSLPAIPPFNFKLTVCKPSHFPSGLETYDESEQSFYRTIRLKGNVCIGLKMRDLEKGANNPGLHVEVYSQNKLLTQEVDYLKKYVNNAYGLNENINEFYKSVAGDEKLNIIIDDLKGMRNSCFENLYEIINISTMLQNTNIKRTEKMMNSMLSNYGNVITYSNKELFVFYAPDNIINTSEQDLRNLKLGYRSKFIVGTAKYFKENKKIEEEIKKMNAVEAKKKLLEVRGIGPYTANLILFSYLRYPNFINFDVWNRKILARHLFDNEDTPLEDLINTCEQRWGKYQGYAALYIIESSFVHNPKLQYWRKDNKKI